MKNTDRIIKDLNDAKQLRLDSIRFYVGKYTGNNPSVVATLRKKGYKVERFPSGYYEIWSVKNETI